MFKNYRDITDVVSLLVYCPSEKCYLFTKEASGELWIPSSKCDKNCWKITANKINSELFGADNLAPCNPLRVYKIWLPNHHLQCVYHAVYKVAVKNEYRKRLKFKSGMRNRLQWLNTVDLEKQRAHSNLRSPEIAVFALMALGDGVKDPDITILASNLQELDTGTLIEVCEENVVIGSGSTPVAAAGAVPTPPPNAQLLAAAGYTIESQVRMYREFVLMVYPAIYMSVNVFSQFMVDLGWQRPQCQSLFRAADITGRGGLSFLELMLWTAALEPATPHTGIAAEIRCRYIFRYFDNNRDQRLEYVEFKELVAAARAVRQLPIDALTVSRDADIVLRQLGFQPNCQLPLADFLRGISELRLRGTSSLLRAPRGISAYLADLQDRDRDPLVVSGFKGLSASSASYKGANGEDKCFKGSVPVGSSGHVEGSHQAAMQSAGHHAARPDYCVAVFTVRMHRRPPNEMLELNNFDEDAVSPSTARLLVTAVQSFDVLGPTSIPVEALAAVHYFASTIEKPQRRPSAGNNALHMAKQAWSWTLPVEEVAMGSLLLRLAEAVRPICANEPRLLRLTSPVYAVGDLHGNLSALLSMESALWPGGAALAAARILFLGDYVDRGAHGTELMAYLLAAKLQRPDAVLMVRGNHETRDIQKMFTFYNECIVKYGDSEGNKIWTAINNVFDVLPLAAVVDDKVFCCHGGIPPPWVCPLISAIDKIPVPLTKPAEQSSIAWELLWNDPIKPNKMTATLQLELASNEGFAANAKRGTGHVFDQNALDRFLLANQLSHVVRAHEMHQNGFMCQLRGRLISVFSSYRYCGGSNDSGVALLEGGKLRLMRVNAD
ncbi:unnamed protein product [Chrysodeixis includens]|uniref:Serine/threonine-protein phosphatase n=1 Tax=Chrysodeixis includens TaxID=689277 RepID=A0A9P0C000_CHRIL|nr:unnamed protein product [Chrysodeixis includens]